MGGREGEDITHIENILLAFAMKRIEQFLYYTYINVLYVHMSKLLFLYVD